MKDGTKKKALILENSQQILRSLQEILEEAGFEAFGTWSGNEALTLLMSGTFDVLLVDDYLPDLYVGEFLERVGHLPVQPWIVVMQGSKPKGSKLRHYEALGACAVVDKRDPAKVRQAVSYCSGDEPLARIN